MSDHPTNGLKNLDHPDEERGSGIGADDNVSTTDTTHRYTFQDLSILKDARKHKSVA